MIGPGEVHVWYVDLTAQGDLAGLLNEEERQRAARFVHPEPRAQFVAARGSLRRLLSRYTGEDPRRIAFATIGNGKPCLASGAVRFNVSHSGNGALIAVSREIEVGVDLEWLRPRETYPDLARRFFTATEADAVCDLRSFYAVWTRKEAFLKALGLGLAGGLERFAVTHDEPARVLHVDGDADAGARWTLVSLEPEAGAIGAVAFEGRAVVTLGEPP
jgi:4'-phosphopantetheinyl transferase